MKRSKNRTAHMILYLWKGLSKDEIPITVVRNSRKGKNRSEIYPIWGTSSIKHSFWLLDVSEI